MPNQAFACHDLHDGPTESGTDPELSGASRFYRHTLHRLDEYAEYRCHHALRTLARLRNVCMKFAFALMFLLFGAAPAMALRCDGRLVDEGDHALLVRKHCGEPFWIDRYSEWLIQDEDGAREQRVEISVEVWFYNFGDDRFMQKLSFRDDRLQREEALGYGFDRLPQRCKHDTLPEGLSSGEVIARCGYPQRRSETYRDQVNRDHSGNARVHVSRREDWIYGDAGRRDARVLVLIDGRLAETQRLDD